MAGQTVEPKGNVIKLRNDRISTIDAIRRDCAFKMAERRKKHDKNIQTSELVRNINYNLVKKNDN